MDNVNKDVDTIGASESEYHKKLQNIRAFRKDIEEKITNTNLTDDQFEIVIERSDKIMEKIDKIKENVEKYNGKKITFKQFS